MTLHYLGIQSSQIFGINFICWFSCTWTFPPIPSCLIGLWWCIC